MRKDGIENLPVRQAGTEYKDQNHTPGSEEGFVLVMSLLLLLAATLLGVTALENSTTNVMMSGNQRLSALNFSAADSGVATSIPVINNTAFFGEVSTRYDSIVPDSADLAAEIHGATIADCPNPSADCPAPAPDIDFSLADTNSYIDVDHLYAVPKVGSALEFASGYDGLGKGAGGGGVSIYYAVTSVGQGLIGSETAVNAIYRYVTK